MREIKRCGLRIDEVADIIRPGVRSAPMPKGIPNEMFGNTPVRYGRILSAPTFSE